MQIIVIAVNFIVGLDINELFHTRLQQHPERSTLEPDLQLVSMPKSGGVAERSHDERKAHREGRVRNQIYGHPLRSPKQIPFYHEVDFSEILLCKLGSKLLSLHIWLNYYTYAF